MPFTSEQRMKHEFNSRRLFGITRSKGKMYELGLPLESHIAVPENSYPEELFVLTVSTLGDMAAKLCDSDDITLPILPNELDELNFSASFFDAYIESKFSENLNREITLLASASYYLANRPGSSLVMARRLSNVSNDFHTVDELLLWILQAKWDEYKEIKHPYFGEEFLKIPQLLTQHFNDGSGTDELKLLVKGLKNKAYKYGTSKELLYIDIINAVTCKRLAASAWTTLPIFTGINTSEWAAAIRRPKFPKELWPSQILLGRAGFFSGYSGVIQMPTSAGKTRSMDIVLRSSFASGRTNLAIVVAPFRALCHEISTSLKHEFKYDDVKVNELSDAIQLDFLQEVAELLGSDIPTSKYILTVTPEKLLYVLRQAPNLVKTIGLVIYDEGHQFDSGSRGITYELLLTEIKELLKSNAQTILISAVIQNAQSIGDWLIGENAKIINGGDLLSTTRSVAFASWMERLGQLIFFETENYSNFDYFVPRVIEQQIFEKKPRERLENAFPKKKNSNDIALYLGIRLAPQGAVAIFCGRKDTASIIASRAVQIYERGFVLEPPSKYSNPEEIQRMSQLLKEHFGERSVLYKAAALGIFVHHGATPHGIRLSIEFGMQNSLLNFVTCTSTLAQGVNLPIRYLIVTGIYQAGEKIKVRDFQNLIGRAGRSGMHTEGLVIFADSDVFDLRRSESWKFNSSVELLNPNLSEAINSSLLTLLLPFFTKDEKQSLTIYPEMLLDLILADEDYWIGFANEVVRLNPSFNFETKSICNDIKYRRKLLFSIESYLMANRGSISSEEFVLASEQLASKTLAYYLAADELKPGVKLIFRKVAEYIERFEPNVVKQASYSKTLLGVKNSQEIEVWVNENREILSSLDSNKRWLEKTFELFQSLSSNKFFKTVEPHQLAMEIASRWVDGVSYEQIFSITNLNKGTKPWGENKRRKLQDEDIIDFCENTLGFECSLILGAVNQFLFGDITQVQPSPLSHFQKSLKYGVPDELSISIYEKGFRDRVIAQKISNTLTSWGYEEKFLNSFGPYREVIELELSDYPSYFMNILDTI